MARMRWDGEEWVEKEKSDGVQYELLTPPTNDNLASHSGRLPCDYDERAAEAWAAARAAALCNGILAEQDSRGTSSGG